MARQYIAPPSYVQMLQNNGQGQGNMGSNGNSAYSTYYAPATNGQTGGYTANSQGVYSGTRSNDSLDQNANYTNAVNQRYSADSNALGSGINTPYGLKYDPRQLSTYAQSQQRMYQGGPVTDGDPNNQYAYDNAMRNNLQNVGAQRGSGGQAQGLRAAMMGTSGASGRQANATMMTNQEQTSQRQGIMNQRLQMEGEQQQAEKAAADEEHRWDTEKNAQDADTQGQVFQTFGNMAKMMTMSDARAKEIAAAEEKAKKTKRVPAPKLVIMIHHGQSSDGDGGGEGY